MRVDRMSLIESGVNINEIKWEQYSKEDKSKKLWLILDILSALSVRAMDFFLFEIIIIIYNYKRNYIQGKT